MQNFGNQWQDLRQKEREHNAQTFGIPANPSRTFVQGNRGGRGGFRGGYSQNNGGGGYGQNNGGGGGYGQNSAGSWGGMSRGGNFGRGGMRYNNGGGMRGSGGMRGQQNQGVYTY